MNPYSRVRDLVALRAFLGEGRYSSSLWSGTGAEMEVFPHGDRWEWAVFRTFTMTVGSGSHTGRGIGAWLEGGSWRRPAPDELHGRCRNQGDAWAAARSVVDAERRRVAAVQNVEMQRRTERVPL